MSGTTILLGVSPFLGFLQDFVIVVIGSWGRGLLFSLGCMNGRNVISCNN